MVFCGDIALPSKGVIDIQGLPEKLRKESWVGNLEGSLCLDNGLHGLLDKRIVFNSMDAIRTLSENINFKCFVIANNHLLDVAPAEYTVWNLHTLQIKHVGGGSNTQSAKKPIEFSDYIITAFGWENISCVCATDILGGVNSYNRDNCIRQVEYLKSSFPEKKLVYFMHWNYELEKYPQPYDRQLAMDLIDMGVSAVIGCHAHQVQPIEFYKGRPIVYGLGNFLFCQGHYMGGNLRFPKFCEEEYVFEITGGNDKFVLHYFHYDGQENKLEYVKSEEIRPDLEFDGKAEFAGFTMKEYETWFKKHRVQKKLLPIFHAKESAISYWIKSKWIKTRQALINLLMKVNLKSANRSQRT